MSDTPDTDNLARGNHVVPTEFAQDLEEERDQARHLADAAMWEADRLRGQLWRARDRAWRLARERNHWKSESLEQAKLLAMSADREEKLRMELQQARDCFSAAMELAERYKTERDAIP